MFYPNKPFSVNRTLFEDLGLLLKSYQTHDVRSSTMHILHKQQQLDVKKTINALSTDFAQ